MGSACAPSYANLYLGWWEATVVFGDEADLLTDRIGLWARYIDDVFILWQGTEAEFHDFTTSLNNNNCGLRFTSEIHKNGISFLDVLISRGKGVGYILMSTENLHLPTPYSIGAAHIHSLSKKASPLGNIFALKETALQSQHSKPKQGTFVPDFWTRDTLTLSLGKPTRKPFTLTALSSSYHGVEMGLITRRRSD